ncbi:Uncharacterized protein APZ42_030988 [Daphnia magna]|uniref:Uncharacterized protein n=1 Tax=Daphnia magna TaxID=35525 RepID=A0A164N789_9CRUS|nr:Uncharacterized protein APZ42_030988 [Daphnia magna]
MRLKETPKLKVVKPILFLRPFRLDTTGLDFQRVKHQIVSTSFTSATTKKNLKAVQTQKVLRLLFIGTIVRGQQSFR